MSVCEHNLYSKKYFFFSYFLQYKIFKKYISTSKWIIICYKNAIKIYPFFTYELNEIKIK